MSILLALVLAAEAAGPNVTLPLEEYEKLRQLRERPSLTVVDLLRVEGSFARRDLAVTMQGRASGTQPTTEVLGGDGFRLYGCTGEALVTRAETGRFALTPLAPRFEARCRVALDGSDRLEGTALAAVLDVASTVADGELVASGEGADRSFSVVRRLAGSDAVLPPSVAGRYKVTLLPEESRFHYRFEVRNPNRSRHRFAIPLREAEHVESVNAPVAWDREGSGYRFDLPPGESVIELNGRLTGTSFAPPIAASLQYLLLESHPLIRAEVTGSAKRVGVGEVGLGVEYRGAQAFLLEAGRELGWKTVRLEALKTAGLAVSSLEQIFFLGAAREVRAETTLAIDNQGAPALELPVQGEPTFASIDAEPAFLTRNEAGALFLPLGQGSQAVVVQAKRPFRSLLGIGVARLELPRLGAPASQARVELRYPQEWRPLYEELSPEGRLHLLDWPEVMLLALLAVALVRLLTLLRLPPRRRALLSAAVVLAASLSQVVYVVAFSAAVVAFVALAIAWLSRRQRGIQLATAVAGVVTAGLVVLWVVDLAAVGAPFAPAARDESSADRYRVAPSSPAFANLAKEKGAEGAIDRVLEPAPMQAPVAAPAASGYQGLPARIEIPRGATESHFGRQLLATDPARRVLVLLVSSRLVALLTWATTLLSLGLVLLWRGELARGGREVVARLRGPPPTATTGAQPA